MAQRNKDKEGNGAGTQMQETQTGRRTSPARMNEGSPSVWHPLTRLREEVDSLFDSFLGRWPTLWERDWRPERFWDVDVEEKDKELVVRAEAPGFEPKDFNIEVSGNTLMIRAEHEQEAENKTGGSRSWERRYGRFQRSIPL